MDSEKEEEDSMEEMEASTSRPEESLSRPAAETVDPALKKAQVKELRRVKKCDYSWLAGVLDS